MDFYNRFLTHPGTVDIPTVTPELYIDKSKLICKSNYSNGLFSKDHIAKGNFVCYMNSYYSCMCNDAMVDLSDLISTKTHNNFYDALRQIKQKYFDENVAKTKVNIVSSASKSGSACYVALKDILPEEELYRVYGFPVWYIEFIIFVTCNNIKGYHKFLSEINERDIESPDYIRKIKILQDVVSNHLDDDRPFLDSIISREYNEKLELPEAPLLGDCNLF